jgi:hypothetical protein
MRNSARAGITPHLALESGKAPFPGRFPERGTEESNLALRFWRPPCYRYTSPPKWPFCRHFGVFGALSWGEAWRELCQATCPPLDRYAGAKDTRQALSHEVTNGRHVIRGYRGGDVYSFGLRTRISMSCSAAAIRLS